MKNIYLRGQIRKGVSLAVFMQILVSGSICRASDALAWEGFGYNTPPKEVQITDVTQQRMKRTISGRVIDSESEPIVGATVQVKGESSGVITDINGKYEISVSNPDIILVVSFIGYQKTEVKTDGRNIVNIRLQENVQNLEEVTVVAYGVQKKATLTGAISSIGTQALVKSPSASIGNALAGQLPGVSSIQASGQPGADEATLYVRGMGSLFEDSASPLILVDGVERSFSQMDPNEIESINVLKDASATAVFGVRGANGVILVTTRRGEEGKTKININSSVGMQMPTRILDIADSYTTASVFTDYQRRIGISKEKLAFSDYDLERFRLGDEPIMYPNIDWYDYMMNKAAVQTQHNVNISGGTKNVRYFISLGMLYQNGLMKKFEGMGVNSNYKYTRYNYRANLDFNITPTTLLKFNMGGIVGTRVEPQKNIWSMLAQSVPMSSPGVIEGKKVITAPNRFEGFGINYAQQAFNAYYGLGYSRNVNNNMNFDLQLTQKLDFITKGLSIEVKGAYNTNYSFSKSVSGHVETYNPYYKSQIDGSGLTIEDPDFDKTVVYRISGQNQMNTHSGGKPGGRGRDWYLEGSIRYNRKFGSHSVGGLLLYNQSKEYYPKQYSDVPTAYVGLVGRLTYDYKSKYMAEFNIGHNGSENFAPGRRFGTFPAGSAGYIITEEDFFPKNDILTYLKLRGSVGLVGNDNMANNRFLYIGSYAIDNTSGIDGNWDKNGYVFGLTNTAYQPGAFEMDLANPEVSWETALKQNYGLDAYFFKDKLKLSVDYFIEKRRDILINRLTVPSLLSINSILPVLNLGKVNNKGYEIEVKWNDNIKDFSYYVNANMSYSRNKVIFMDEVEPNEPYMRKTGHEVNAIQGYVALGFYKKDDFNEDGSLKENLPKPLTKKIPGDVKFADLNGDNIIDSDDIKRIGYPKRPRYTFGLNIGADYKGFSISMNWTGVTACNVEMSKWFKRPLDNSPLFQYLADGLWSEQNQENAKFPVIKGSPDNENTSSIWVKDGSYIKLKNLILGYDIRNPKILKAIGASKLSVQFTGYNLLTFDKLKIADPEANLSVANTYPITKIFSVGANITF